jgi:hypothetical protein
MIDYDAMTVAMLAEVRKHRFTDRRVKDHDPYRLQLVIDRLKDEGYNAYVIRDVLYAIKPIPFQ